MGQARIKRQVAFAQDLVTGWEADDCINFAVALARITGWLIHVDWWVPSTNEAVELPIEKFKPLRVYVADNGDGIFDVRGVRRIVDFSQKTIAPLAYRYGNGGVRTRFYSEDGLNQLPLASKPDEMKIAAAEKVIRHNAAYLAMIPARAPSAIPAHLAARYVYGLCVPFAEAICEVTGLTPTAMLAVRFRPEFDGTRRSATGFFHSVVMHPDGEAEDSWGKASLETIAERFGVVEFSLSASEHRNVAASQRQASAERFQAALVAAKQIVTMYRG